MLTSIKDIVSPRYWLVRVALIVTLWLVTAYGALAHEIKPALAELNYTSKTAVKSLSVDLVVNLESLIAEIGPDHEDTNESANRARYEELRTLEADALFAEFNEFNSRFLADITITDINNAPIALRVESVEIPTVGDISLPRDTNISLSAELPDNVVTLQWQWSESFGEVIVRANSDSQTMDYATLLSPGQASGLINFTTESKQGALSVLSNYIVVGFEHILPKGMDHILFVLGLFLLSARWRPLLLQITTFTVAHSITLALGASNLISISSSIVEPLIALSIVFICVENVLFMNLSRWRLGIVFVFGLLHGLGFASVLEEVGLDMSNFFIALLGFNIGVELGQLLIVAVCLLSVGIWFGKKAWYRRFFSMPASVVIGLVGMFWFVQRTVL